MSPSWAPDSHPARGRVVLRYSGSTTVGERKAAGARVKDEGRDGGAGRWAGQEAASGHTETGAEARDTDAGGDLDEDRAEAARQDAQRPGVDHLDRRVRRPAQRRRLRALAHETGRRDREDRAEANSQYRYFHLPPSPIY